VSVTPKTIYLEMDEEVTSVIDKIRRTEFTDVVLVVPKDASISQSVVNLKLIKRKADELNKNVSIVTQDKVARNLAAKIGIATAANSNDMPRVASVGSDESPVKYRGEENGGPLENTNEVIFDKEPVAEEPAELTVVEGEDVRDEVEMHEDAHKKADKKEQNLMPKFPWKWVILVTGFTVLALFIAGYVYLPRAKATISVVAEGKPISLDFTGTKDAKLDTTKVVIPTQIVEVTKEQSKQFPTTGQKDAGTKATGTLTISAKAGAFDSYPVTVVAGTRFAPDGSSLIYRSTAAVDVPMFPQTVTVSVAADGTGSDYNGFANKSFNLASSSDFYASSTAGGMTGGTTKQVSVVSQGDINSAKDSLSKDVTDAVTADFNTQASELKIVDDTKTSSIVSSSASPDLNAEATTFTMTVKVTMKAIGFSMDDISSLITAEVNRQLGTTKQIIDDGSKAAQISVDSSDIGTGNISGTITTTAYVSAKLDEDNIKVNLEGLNDAKAKNYLAGLDGVRGSQLEYWPTFIKSFPRIKSHIYITVQVADSSKN
jgi:hypothetical protein